MIVNSIVIGPKEIDCFSFERKKKDLILHSVAVFPFEGEGEEYMGFVEKSVSDISEISTKSRLVNFIVVGAEVLKFIQPVDSVSRAAVLSRFKEFFDINLADYYIDYETFEYNQKHIAFVAGINREYVEKMVSFFKNKGFKLLCLETEINALRRVLAKSYPEGIVLGINVREHDSTIVIFSGDAIFSYRDINYGYRNVIGSISETTGLPEEDIKREVKKRDNDVSEELISDAIGGLTIEIQRTIDFYNSQYRQEPVNKIVITGRINEMAKIDRILSNLIGIPSEKHFPEKRILSLTDYDVENINYLVEGIGLGYRVYG